MTLNTAVELPHKGMRIEEYELLEPLGAGMFAVVHKARDHRLERDVAIKIVLPTAIRMNEDLPRRFLREVDLAKRLEHPNIVRMYDYGQTESGLLWMAMEYINGVELRTLSAEEGKLDPARAVRICLQLLEGVAVAHTLGIIHRDLKPSNIMLMEMGVSEDLVKVLDFGIGKALGEDESSAIQDITHEDTSTTGTPRYMAPEQLRHGKVGPEVDVYSIGLILFEMLTGEQAVKGSSTFEILSHVISDNVELPDWLEFTELGELIQRATAKQPFDRYASAVELHRALKRLNLETALEVHRPRRGGFRLWVAAFVGLFVIGGALWWALSLESVPEVVPEVVFVPSGPVLKLGWTPTVDGSVLAQEVEPLRLYLERALDRPIVLQFAATYDELAQEVLNRRVPFAIFPPLLYVHTEEKLPWGSLEVLVFKEFDGITSTDGYLLVRYDSPANTLADLQGKRFCLTNRESTTGYLMPRAYLRRQGYDPDPFIGEIQWSGDHLQVMRDLIDGHCDVAATYAGVYMNAGTYDIPTAKLRIFGLTGRVLEDVVVAGPDATREEIRALHDALVAFDPAVVVGTQSLGQTQHITGFVDADDKVFDEFREIVSAERKASAKQ